MSTSSGAAIRDGRYEGGDGVMFVELRVDAAGAAVLSGDVYDSSNGGSQYVASVRTAPGTRFDGGPGPWPAVWQDSIGATALGAVRLTASDVDTATVALRVNTRLN